MMRSMPPTILLVLVLCAAATSALRPPVTGAPMRAFARRHLLALAAAPLAPALASAYGVPTRPDRTKGGLSVSLSDLLDEEAATDGASEDATQKAKVLREQQAREDAIKQERAAVAIARMDETKETLERSREKALSSGVPLCPENKNFGSNTGVLSAKACSRVRDGLIDQRKATGAFAVF